MLNLVQLEPRCSPYGGTRAIGTLQESFCFTPTFLEKIIPYILFSSSGEDACASNPCKNGATCVDTGATEEGYICRCGDGYHGNQCQSKVPPETSCDALQSSMTANAAEDTSTATVTSTTEIGPAISTSSLTVSGPTTSDLELEQQTPCPGVTLIETQIVSPGTMMTCPQQTVVATTVADTVTVCPSTQELLASVSPSESIEEVSSSSSSEISCPAPEPKPDYCAGDPCGDNGVCYNTTGQYICKCRSGYTGDNCTIGE